VATDDVWATGLENLFAQPCKLLALVRAQATGDLELGQLFVSMVSSARRTRLRQMTPTFVGRDSTDR
jgi:hypothetical protein